MRKPAGVAPAADHVYGVAPPVATSVERTGTPTSATRLERAAVSTAFTFNVICRESTRVPGAAGSTDTAVPVTVNVAAPPAVGVPEIVPSGASARPAGREPELTVQVT